MNIVVEERPRAAFVEASEVYGALRYQDVSVDEQLNEVYGDLRYQDVSVQEQLSDAVDRAAAGDRCKVNPINCLHAIREEIYGEIDSDDSPRIVGRMMHAAGETLGQRRETRNKLLNKEFQFLKL